MEQGGDSCRQAYPTLKLARSRLLHFLFELVNLPLQSHPIMRMDISHIVHAISKLAPRNAPCHANQKSGEDEVFSHRRELVAINTCEVEI